MGQGSNPSKCQIFYLFCYPGEALEGPITTGVCKNSTILNKKTTDENKTISLLKIESNVDIHKNTVYVYIYLYIYTHIYICVYIHT